MKIKQHVLAVSIALFVSLFSEAAARALPAPDEALRSTINDVKSIVQSTKGDVVLDKKLKDKLYPMFDWDEMAKLSLGPNWQKATAPEQEEFKRLFSELLSRTYLKRIKSNVTASELEIIDSKVDGEKPVVKTKVKADGEPVSVDYRLRSDGSGWKAYDVVIENVGLISNYRAEFGEILRKDGMPGLLARLKDKKEETSSR